MKNKLIKATLLLGLLFLISPVFAQKMTIDSYSTFVNPENLIDGTEASTSYFNQNRGLGNIVVKFDKLTSVTVLELDVDPSSIDYAGNIVTSTDSITYNFLGTISNGLNQYNVNSDIQYVQVSFNGVAVAIKELSAKITAEYIAYSYDDAGNRERRYLTVGEIPIQKSAKGDNSKKQKSNLNWDELGLKLYPNPTHGELILEFENYPEDKRIKVELYNSEGKRILNEKINNNNTMLNIENYPEGMYILHLNVSGEQKTYKIIKN